jgi:hypothetical protein
MTMRFMVMIKATANSEAGVLPETEEFEVMGAYQEQLAQAGVLVDRGYGLKPSSAGARVRFSGGQPTVIDGPFAETKELVAGYSILEAGSREEVIEWVQRWPAPASGEEFEIEIRPIYEEDDFGDIATPELREADARLQAAVAEQHPNG